MDKIELRKSLKISRNNLLKSGHLSEISNKIVSKIKLSVIFNSSKHIGMYYPIKGEINLLNLLNAKDKVFYFPKCINSELYFAKYDGSFTQGAYLIPEPSGDVIDPSILDVIYTPCLCANKRCYRLGYGKGYYDRFFSGNNIKAIKTIVCPEEFITDEFIEDSYDYACDEIISENSHYVNIC